MQHQTDHSEPIEASPSDASAADALPERRREPRLSIATKATLFPPIRNDVVPTGMIAPVGTRRVCLVDISYMGVRFRAGTPHEPGERWRLKVEAGPMKLDAQVEVVRCAFEEATGYEVGARFVSTELPLRSASPVTSIPRNPSRHLVPRKAG
jgi:hypothetical protein